MDRQEKKCCLCGKTFVGWGNNPYPLCDKTDTESRCCDDCNVKYVIPARIALNARDKKNENYQIGDRILILHLQGESPRNMLNYRFKQGDITSIDDLGQLHGTWGGLAIIPDSDIILKISDNN